MDGHHMSISGGKMRWARSAARLAVCYPALGPSHVGGPSKLAQCEDEGPHLFAAKALVPRMLPQGLIGTSAPIRHPRALRTYPSRSRQS